MKNEPRRSVSVSGRSGLVRPDGALRKNGGENNLNLYNALNNDRPDMPFAHGVRNDGPEEF